MSDNDTTTLEQTDDEPFARDRPVRHAADGSSPIPETTAATELNARQRQRLSRAVAQTVTASRADHDSLSAEDLAELMTAAAAARHTQQELLQAQRQAQQLIQSARDEAVGAAKVHDYVLTRLRTRYGLVETDIVHPDGAITYQPPRVAKSSDS